jgi:hypothetical protein
VVVRREKKSLRLGRFPTFLDGPSAGAFASTFARAFLDLGQRFAQVFKKKSITIKPQFTFFETNTHLLTTFWWDLFC